MVYIVTPFLSLYLVFKLKNSRNTNKFILKNCSLGTINQRSARNASKGKFVQNGRKIGFDGADSWSFGNDFARNVVTFGEGNSLSSHPNNQRNNFLVLDEGPIDHFNDSVGTAEKKIAINFTKVNTKFSLSLFYNGDESYLHMNKTEICKFKAH